MYLCVIQLHRILRRYMSMYHQNQHLDLCTLCTSGAVVQVYNIVPTGYFLTDYFLLCGTH